MKLKTSLIRFALTGTAVIAVSLLLIAWDFRGNAFHFTGNHHYADTVPPKKQKTEREKKIRDLDEALKELEKVNIELDVKNMKQELEAALKNLDAEKIQLEIENALREVDMKKIKSEIQESLARIDGDKIRAEVDKALKEVDFSKIREDLMQSLKQVDMDKIRAELDMEKLRTEMKELEEELKKTVPEVEKSLEKAKIEIEKAKAELKEWKGFIDSLEKDGLINKKDGYILKHKEGEFFINGKKQPVDVYNKYKVFLQKHQSFTIDSEDRSDFTIEID
jgi:DNA repair exonuclease SbcCD ATPase subunit